MATYAELMEQAERRKKSRRVFLGTLSVAGLGLAAWQLPRWLREEEIEASPQRTTLTNSETSERKRQMYSVSDEELKRLESLEEAMWVEIGSRQSRYLQWSLHGDEGGAYVLLIGDMPPATDAYFSARGAGGFAVGDVVVIYTPMLKKQLFARQEAALMPGTLAYEVEQKTDRPFFEIPFHDLVSDTLLHEFTHVWIYQKYGDNTVVPNAEKRVYAEECLAFLTTLMNGSQPRYELFKQIQCGAMEGYRLEREAQKALSRQIVDAAGGIERLANSFPSPVEIHDAARRVWRANFSRIEREYILQR